MAQRSADPDKVVVKLRAQIGAMYYEIIARDAIMEDMEEEITSLKSQLEKEKS